MGGLLLSGVAAIAIVGGYLAIDSSQQKIVNNYHQAKTVVAYVNKAEAKHSFSYADIGAEPQNFVIGSTKEKSEIRKFSRAMRVVLKTNQNPTCNDLAKTGDISYQECTNLVSQKNAFVELNNGNINIKNANENKQIQAQSSQVAHIVQAYVLPKGYQTQTSQNSNNANSIELSNIPAATAVYVKKDHKDFVKIHKIQAYVLTNMHKVNSPVSKGIDNQHFSALSSSGVTANMLKTVMAGKKMPMSMPTNNFDNFGMGYHNSMPTNNFDMDYHNIDDKNKNSQNSHGFHSFGW